MVLFATGQNSVLFGRLIKSFSVAQVPANKRTATGKPSAIGSSARGRYVRYIFCGEREAVVTRAESTTSHEPVFQSGGQHHLMLRSLQELHQRLSQYEGVRFQIMGRSASGADTVLAEALLPSEALLELAIDADESLADGASGELPARDFTLEAVVDTAAAKAAGAIIPSQTSKPQPVLRLCVEYQCAPLRLRDNSTAASLPARQFPGQASLSVSILHCKGLAKAADAAGLQAETMEDGLNVYITCYIYDGKHVTDVVQTGIVRQSFAPKFNFTELLSLDLSREFLLGSARAASEVVFEARHRPADAPPPSGDAGEDESHDIVLGTAAVPLLPVLQSETGVDGTYELRTDKQQSVGKIQVHLQVPGVHAPFDPTAAAISDAMASDGLAEQTETETLPRAPRADEPTHPLDQSVSGNTKYLLRSRVTINIPDARLPPSVLQPLVAQDVLFYMRCAPTRKVSVRVPLFLHASEPSTCWRQAGTSGTTKLTGPTHPYAGCGPIVACCQPTHAASWSTRMLTSHAISKKARSSSSCSQSAATVRIAQHYFRWTRAYAAKLLRLSDESAAHSTMSHRSRDRKRTRGTVSCLTHRCCSFYVAAV